MLFRSLTELGETILSSWRTYSDDAVDILSYSDGENHNTITPIARMRDDYYELDLVLRNNRTNEEHPMGIFHPHEEVHHMKKENIGLIEVMGLAVLPRRLVEEMELLARYIKNNELDQAAEDAIVSKHVPWAKRVVDRKSTRLNSSHRT